MDNTAYTLRTHDLAFQYISRVVERVLGWVGRVNIERVKRGIGVIEVRPEGYMDGSGSDIQRYMKSWAKLEILIWALGIKKKKATR